MAQYIHRLIRKDLLRLDPSYQREPVRSRVAKYAREWDEALAGVLTVNFRQSDERYYIIDGGHRHAAAMLNDKVEALACNVLHLESVRQEAEYFGRINTAQKKPTPYEMHRALVEAGEPFALEVESIVVRNGYKIANGDGMWSFRAIIEMRKLCASDVANAATVFALAADLARGEKITYDLLRGIDMLNRVGNYSPFSGKHRDRIIAAGYKFVMASIQESANIHKGNKKAYAYGIAEAANKGYRTMKIELNP